MLLRGLLYLGALMTVLAVSYLVLQYWDQLPMAAQLAYIMAVPATFYAAGWYARQRLELPQAGGVLAGIGAILVALDFAAVYQFGDLGNYVNPSLYWLIAFLVCTAIYLLTAWRLPTEFFGYITLFGMTGCIVAFTSLFWRDPAWLMTAFTLSAILMIGIAVQFRHFNSRWHKLFLACRRLPLLLLPLTQLVVLFIPGGFGVAQTAVFVLATCGYLLLAWQFPNRIYSYALPVSTLLTIAIALITLQMPLWWLPFNMILIAGVYLLAGRITEAQLELNSSWRRETYLFLYFLGFGLLLAGTAGAFLLLAVDWVYGIATLYLATLLYLTCALLFSAPHFVLAAGGLFILPLSIHAYQWLLANNIPQPTVWLMVIWSSLACLYIFITRLLQWQAPPVGKQISAAGWLFLIAHLLLPLAFITILINYQIYTAVWIAGPTLICLAIMLVAYIMSAGLNDRQSLQIPAATLNQHLPRALAQNLFLWPLCFLVAAFITVAWLASPWPFSWLGLPLAMVGLVYLIFGQWAANRRPAYRYPFYTLATLLILSSIFIAYGNTWALITALLMATLFCLRSAAQFRQGAYLALAIGLFVGPYSLMVVEWLTMRTWTQAWEWFMVSWTVLAIIYLGLASLWQKQISPSARDEAFKEGAFQMQPALWLNGWAQLLTPLSLVMVAFLASTHQGLWLNTPSLLVLTAVIFFYLVSAILHDRDTFPALSRPIQNSLPADLAQSLFLWPLAFLVPCWFGLAWYGSILPWPWLGILFVILASGYLGLGSWLEKRQPIYRLPFYGFAFALAALGPILALNNVWAFSVALFLDTLFLIHSALQFRQAGFILAATGLFIAPLSITSTQLMFDNDVLHLEAWLFTIWAVLALVYLGLAWLWQQWSPTAQKETKFNHWGLPMRTAQWLTLWANLLVPAALIGLVVIYLNTLSQAFIWIAVFSVGLSLLFYLFLALFHDSGRFPTFSNPLQAILPQWAATSAYLWPMALLLPVGIALIWLGMSWNTIWFGTFLAGLAMVYVGGGQGLGHRQLAYRIPWQVVAYALAVCGIFLAFAAPVPLLISLLLVVATFLTLAAIYRRIFEMAVAALLFIWPFQLALALSPLPGETYALAYALLATAVYTISGITIHRQNRQAHTGDGRWQLINRQGQGVVVTVIGYLLAGYALSLSFTTGFSQANPIAIWVAVLVPLIILGQQLYSLYWLRLGVFAWVAMPLICLTYGQLLPAITLPDAYMAAAWAILALSCLLWERGLALKWTNGWWQPLTLPLRLTAVLLWCLSLGLTAIDTFTIFTSNLEMLFLPQIVAQLLLIVFVVVTARLYRQRWPLFLEPGLLFWPVTLFFVGYSQQIGIETMAPVDFSFVWLALALVHLGVAVWLDASPVRYAHGLFAGGYGLVMWALLWSLADHQTNLIILAVTIGIAAASQWLFHRGHHRSYGSFVSKFWPIPETVGYWLAYTGFLFIAAFLLPVWLGSLLWFLAVPVAWLGVSFALVAPLYIALGMLLRRACATYTWPLYSAGYGLTAVAAMLAFDDIQLAILVLSLNVVVYAVSTYIFKQPFWLYLSNLLLPIILLLTFQHNEQLTATAVATAFMGLAFLYLLAGRWLDKRLAESGFVSPFALPFYGPGFLLSAIALAVAGESVVLATFIFSAAVCLYGLAAWLFREQLFLYPAVWLTAVPYFLVLRQTNLPSIWYGLAWLPLILITLSLGQFCSRRFVIAARFWQRLSTPFYLLAYGLSLAMILQSTPEPLPLTLSLLAAALLYFASARALPAHRLVIPGIDQHPSVTPFRFHHRPNRRPGSGHCPSIPSLNLGIGAYRLNFESTHRPARG